MRPSNSQASRSGKDVTEATLQSSNMNNASKRLDASVELTINAIVSGVVKWR